MFFEFGRALIGVPDDVNEIAAEGVFVDEIVDLEGLPQEGRRGIVLGTGQVNFNSSHSGTQ